MSAATAVLMAMLVLGIVAATPAATLAAGEEPRLASLREHFQRDELRLGVLMQVVADLQGERTFPGENGFSVATMRLSVRGELDEGYGYFLQADFRRTPAVLDARLSYRFSPMVAVDVGQFKAPFSYELLTSAASIDFVNRAQVVTALAPGRQIGAQLRTRNQARSLGFDIGAFNGNGIGPNGNDNDSFLLAARLAGHRDEARAGDATLDAGFNVAFSHDAAATLGGGLIGGFAGERAVFGTDVRFTRGTLLLAGELIFATLDPEVGAKRDPWGFHATAGTHLSDNAQLLVRWDAFNPDAGGGRNDWVLIGLNLVPTSAASFQINWVIDSDRAALEHHQLLTNFQFAF